MDYETMIQHIDNAVNVFPSIKVMVITGGECFLLGNRLRDVVEYGSKKYSLTTRVVTNGYWASTLTKAKQTISTLVEAGLKEINFSTGDNHQKYVPVDNIVNATIASSETSLETILISVETTPNSNFTSTYLTSHPDLNPLIRSGRVKYTNAAWMNFRVPKGQSVQNTSSVVSAPITRKPCENILRGIFINPHSRMLSCCGLTVEYNPFLKPGIIDSQNIKELYEKQFSDLFKIWLYIDGPEYIYRKVTEAENGVPQFFPHDCAYCIELCKNPRHVRTIQEIAPKELPGMMYRQMSVGAMKERLGASSPANG